MLPTMFATCSVAFMLVSPVVRILGAATAWGNSGPSLANTASIRAAGSEAICKKRLTIVIRTPRRLRPAERVGIVVHLGHVDRGAAPGRAQLAAHDERATGAALNEQDRLTVAEHGGQAARDVRVEVAAGDDDDDVGAVHRRRELRRHQLQRGPALDQALDVEPAALAHLGDAGLVDVVQAESVARRPRFATSAMPPRPAPMIVTVVLPPCWFMRKYSSRAAAIEASICARDSRRSLQRRRSPLVSGAQEE